MKVSIIVPVYNTAVYLDRCLDSLTSQTYQDIEIILVNNGSTDYSRQACKWWCEKDSRIKYFEKENDYSPSGPRNMGLDNATGEYVCFVDSDDCVSPLYVENLLKMCTDNDVKLSVCGFTQNDETTPVEMIPVPLRLYNTEIIPQRDYFLRLYTPMEVVYVVVWGKMYHKSIFETLRFETGKLNEDEGIIHHIASQCENMAVCYEPLYFYTKREGSIMNSAGFSEKMLDIFPFLQDRMDYFTEKEWHDLTFLTMKNYLVKCLELYNLVADDVADGGMYKKHMLQMYKQMLSQAKKCPVKSRKFLMKMDYYALFPAKFRGTDRAQLLFGEAGQ
ncbi:MAG: glycosyltransferase family 2 protein [Oscillospiraceae bacterium]|nr:glycosyltransferase family 2 protein [Oscillospiraceae bacterium]